MGGEMKELKPGDRVAVFNNGLRDLRIVTKVEGVLIYFLVDGGQLRWVHAKQCRKLVKKKRGRQWELRGAVTGSWIAGGPELGAGEKVWVEEVKG
jgi:hypothetical protein